MSKNIVRWTIGHNVLPVGIDILGVSVQSAMRALGPNNFDWYVCYNDRTILERLKRVTDGLPVRFILQDWVDIAIPIPRPVPQTGDLEHHDEFSGSVWKLCPIRLDTSVHELSLDNDVIIQRRCEALDRFWEGHLPLVAEDPCRAFGNFDRLIPHYLALNSGLFGMQPGYNPAEDVREFWESAGSPQMVSYLDEQGLLMAAITSRPYTIIEMSTREFLCLHPEWYSDNILTPTPDRANPHWKRYTTELLQEFCRTPILHFCGVNRMPLHVAWSYFNRV